MAARMTAEPRPFLAPGHEFYVVWTDEEGTARYVPSGAPGRIVALAAMKPKARKVSEAVVRTLDARVWHPGIDR